MPKIAAFIDGANLYAGAKALQLDIDYTKLLRFLEGRGQLVRASYYTAILEKEGEEYSPLRPLLDWLSYNGFNVITKLAKSFDDGSGTGRRKIKGNMDIELAVDMLDMADRVDHIFLFSGDGDFRHLIEAVQRKGVRVTVVSTMISQPPMVADELRRQADEFFDIGVQSHIFKKDQKPLGGEVAGLSTSTKKGGIGA
jgi:uncharacterized LabA/DUF88 family protein